MEVSKSHLGFYGDFEYFVIDGKVVRANKSNPIMTSGFRGGARFECMFADWLWLKSRLDMLSA